MSTISKGPFGKGERVRLTARFAANLAASPRVSGVDWSTRVGVIVRCSKVSAEVRWIGRKSEDQVPVRALEKVNEIWSDGQCQTHDVGGHRGSDSGNRSGDLVGSVGRE